MYKLHYDINFPKRLVAHNHSAASLCPVDLENMSVLKHIHFTETYDFTNEDLIDFYFFDKWGFFVTLYFKSETNMLLFKLKYGL